MIDPGVVERWRARVNEAGLGEFKLDDRPWGGEFIFTDEQLKPFVAAFFDELDVSKRGQLATPKFLIVAPDKRFSWQYHYRRGEIWRVLEGPVGLIEGSTDEQPPARILQTGEMVTMGPLMRHRLAGQQNWAVVAELWEHADPAHPSDEADIVRVSDDFGRKVG